MKYVFLITIILVVFATGACSQSETTTEPSPELMPTPGEVHTKFLEDARARLAKGTESSVACLEAANEMLATYDYPPMTLKEVDKYIEKGKELARSVKEFTMTELLSGEELEWWDRFSTEATGYTTREVFEKHCELYGSPKQGSSLEVVTSIVISSAEFWAAEYAGDDRQNKNVTTLLRFCIGLCIDAFMGGLAMIPSGVFGPIVGAIIGGLASWGADMVIFG